MTRFLIVLPLLFASIAGFAADANKPKVAVTIRPLHSIVASIMHGVTEPSLVLAGNQSNHHATLKPSQARILANSEILFWIGPGMESSLVKPIKALGVKSKLVALIEDSAMELLQLPDGRIDPHIWLSTTNALSMARAIKNILASTYPDNASTFDKNLAQFAQEMKLLQRDLDQILEALKNQNFLIYHDALEYLANHYGFKIHSIEVGNEELNPSAKQIAQISKLARSGKFQCLLVEPNINASAVISAAKEAGLPIATIDPGGSGFKAGASLYAEMMRDIARTIANCSN